MKKKILFDLLAASLIMAVVFSLFNPQNALAESQYLSRDSKALVTSTGTHLIMASSPTNSNLRFDRQTQMISGYVWSNDLGWIDFSAGVGVDSSGVLTGSTLANSNLTELYFDRFPHNARVMINSTNNLEGYAWSKDIGWIHFDGAGNAKSLTTNAPLDINQKPMRANVVIDGRTGQMTGYAWNRDLGWIDFAGVRVEADGRVTGQATVKNSNNKLHFNSTLYNANVKVARNGQFSGYAWNDDLGWVAFDGVQTADNSFPIKQVPSKVNNLTIAPISSGSLDKGAVRLSWNKPVSDGGSPITGYVLEYCKSDTLGNCLSASGFSRYSEISADELSLEVDNLSKGDNDHHTFRIRAKNIIGQGEASDKVVSRAGYISLRLTNERVSMTVNPAARQSFSSALQNVKVDSNLSDGLDLRLSAGNNGNLTSISNQVIALAKGNFSSPRALSDNTWGYRVNGGAFGSGTVVETDAADSNFTWARVPTTPFNDVIFTTNSPVSDRTLMVYYGFKVSRSQPAGIYSGSIIYEVIGR